MSRENVEVVRRVTEANRSGDPDATFEVVIALVDAKSEFRSNLNAVEGATYRGHDPRWCHKVDSVEQTEGQGPAVGATYRVLHRPRPLKPAVELVVEVVEADAPHRLRLRETDDDGVFDVTYELEAQAGGSHTRLTQADDIEWSIPRLALPVARMMVGRDLSRQFAALKRLLEAEN